VTLAIAPRPLTLALLGTLACGSNAAGTPSSDATLQDVPEPGVVHVSERSRPFLDIKPVQAGALASAVRAPAHVAFKDGAVAEVAAPIEGRVAAIHVKVGDHVKAGDALVTIQSPAAASARAELESSIAAHRAAEAALGRQKHMLEQGVGIEAEKFQAEIDMTKANAELSRAQRACAYLGEGTGATVVIRAPIEGTVLQRKITLGAAADPNGAPLIEIGDPRGVWAIADVFERDLPLIKPGAAVTVEVATIGQPITGQVTAVGSVVNDGLRTAPVYVTLNAEDSSLRAGMYARASISAAAASSISVPVSAVLIKDGKRSIAYVERDEHTFVAREVVVGPSIDGRAQVITGLVPGDRVVEKGALLLDGSADQLL
jgi:cobalt-zinc-cadmium efflux system membrane fusion protein